MADENRSDVDEAAVRELFTDWDGPVGSYVRQLLDEAEDTARARVPVRTGRLETTIRQVEGRDDVSGEIKGLLGAGYHADPPFGSGFAAGFPVVNALDNSQGFTWNRAPHGSPRTRGTRRLHAFLTEALDALAARGTA